MEKDYGYSFYKDRHENTVHSARTVLSIVSDALPKLESAIDLGCGVGTWLSVLKEIGVGEIQGIDGPWVKQDLLKISREDFRRVSFEEEVSLERTYDLAISLEVAEHLSGESASRFVKSLVSASDFVLFSGAIPFQGGKGHINEQWPDYWVDLFNTFGYVPLDFIRRIIWDDPQIPPWYRQNILLFVKNEKKEYLKIPELGLFDNRFPISVVHPEMYRLKVGKMQTVTGCWKLFLQAVIDKIRR